MGECTWYLGRGARKWLEKVTDAVHGKGGLIVAQLWHTGRVCHPDMIEQRGVGTQCGLQVMWVQEVERCVLSPQRRMKTN